MILTITVLGLFFVVSIYSTIHALGMWLALLITHGVFVLYVGDSAIHLPMYAGIVVTIIILLRKQWHGVSRNTLLLFGSLLLVMTLASALSIDVDRSMQAMMLYGKAFVLALLVAGCVRSENDMKIMMVYCLAALVFGALVTLYQYQTDTFTISNIYKQRAAGLRGDPNDTAMLLVSGVPIAIYWYYNSKEKINKILSLICLPLLLAGIVLTASRSGFLTLLIVAAFIYFRKPTLQLSVIGATMLVLIVMFAPQSYWDRMKTLTDSAGSNSIQDRSIASRATLFKDGVVIFFDNSLIGVGPGNFSSAFYKYRSDSVINFDKSKTGIAVSSREKAVAHNMYLEFFAENGILGGIIFVTILFSSFRSLWRYDYYSSEKNKRISIGFSLALVIGAMLFAGLFLSQGKNSVLWFLIGLGIAAAYIGKNQANDKKV